MIGRSTTTICALATPPGLGGLAVIRISGPSALMIYDRCFPSKIHSTEVQANLVRVGWWKNNGLDLDEVTAVIFRAPHSYTGEDVVEVGCHGGPFVVEQILNSIVASGAHLALPGEFTRRAFLNQKLDLTQVEAVADLIHSESVAGAQTAARQLAGGFTTRLSALRDRLLTSAGLLEVELDFSEEGYEFVSRQAFVDALQEGITMARLLTQSAKASQILRSGFYTSIVGFPNAGKSSLFNTLLGRPRAIVSTAPGTTRDYLEESLIVDGYTVHLFDTAGLRETQDAIEMQGILLTSSLIEQSNLVLVVNDATQALDGSDKLRADIATRFPTAHVVTIQNKMDVLHTDVSAWPGLVRQDDIPASAAVDGGLSAVINLIASEVRTSSAGVMDVLVNTRQAGLLSLLLEHLESAHAALLSSSPADLLAIDVRSAIQVMGEITGETWNPDLLDSIFSRFCIGK